MRGKTITVAIVGFGILGAGGAALYRRLSLPVQAAALAHPDTRPAAFTGLLRFNRLSSLIAEYGCDLGADDAGEPYAQATLEPDRTWRLVRALRRDDEPAKAVVSTFVFRPGGGLTRIEEPSRIVLLGRGPAARGRIVVEDIAAAPGVFSLIAPEIEEASVRLRARGAFVLVSQTGRRYPVTWGGAPTVEPEALPVIEEREDGRLHGPAGGPDRAWEVDLERSPDFVQER